MKDLQGFGESAPLGGCDCFKFDLWIKPDSTAISVKLMTLVGAKPANYRGLSRDHRVRSSCFLAADNGYIYNEKENQ